MRPARLRAVAWATVAQSSSSLSLPSSGVGRAPKWLIVNPTAPNRTRFNNWVDHQHEYQTRTFGDAHHSGIRRLRRLSRSVGGTLTAAAEDLRYPAGHPVEIRDVVQQLVEVRSALVETVQQRHHVIVHRVDQPR